MPASSLTKHQRSTGCGRLSIEWKNNTSSLKEFYQQGCAKIRLPDLHNATHLEAVLINSSGGMTGGDVLDWQLTVDDGAALTVTTQACEKIYASASDTARTTTKLVVGENASLNWLPQETIVYNRADFSRTITADLHLTSEALFIEPMIFGRAAMGEIVEQGAVRDRWRIHQNNQLLHAEDFCLEGAVDSKLQRSAIANGNRAMATILLIAPRAEGLLTPVREILGASGAASFWNGKLLARLVARDGYELRKSLIPVVELLNSSAALPKIWST